MDYTTLISTDILAGHIDDTDWAIIDCRFDLLKPDWGMSDYQLQHIPGAVYAHLNNDLSGPVSAATGRHPLPDSETFRARLSAWGIGANTQVVAYDTTGGSFAARLWWMLRAFGHRAVAVLDGGYPKWVKEQRPCRSGVESRPVAQFEGVFDRSFMVAANDVEQIRLDPAYCLVDARGEPRFRGEQESIDPIAGHIPGAVNRFHANNLSPDGTFLPVETLQQQFTQLFQGIPPERVVVYCGSGVTSCHHLLAMEHVGLQGGRLYVGSWSEWIRDANRPRATGPH